MHLTPRSNDSDENNLFGTSATDNNHFTITAALHDTTPNQDVYVENAKIVTMMNPMNYPDSPVDKCNDSIVFVMVQPTVIHLLHNPIDRRYTCSKPFKSRYGNTI